MSFFGIFGDKKKVPEGIDEIDKIGEEAEEPEVFSPPQEILAQGEIQEPVLINFQKYPDESLRPEFRSLAKMVVSPAPLLGIASGTDIALLTNKFYLQRLRFMTGPKALTSDMYMEYDLLASVVKIIANVSRGGTLLQAETRFPFNVESIISQREVNRR